MTRCRLYFRHACARDDSPALVAACVAHTLSLLQRTLPADVYRVRGGKGGVRRRSGVRSETRLRWHRRSRAAAASPREGALRWRL